MMTMMVTATSISANTSGLVWSTNVCQWIDENRYYDWSRRVLAVHTRCR